MGGRKERKCVTWEIRALFLLVARLDTGAIKSAYRWHQANLPVIYHMILKCDLSNSENPTTSRPPAWYLHAHCEQKGTV
jgi:hypothetical protein